MRIADVATGAVRDVFSETVPTFFESGYKHVNWRYLSKRNEILWFSQRENWGNLYLYDAGTGKLKNAVTEGDWNVDEVLHVDQTTGDMILTGTGREPSEDPYYRRIYSANLDGSICSCSPRRTPITRLLSRGRKIHCRYLFHAAAAAGDGVTRPLRAADRRDGTGRYHAPQSCRVDRTETFHVKGTMARPTFMGCCSAPLTSTRRESIRLSISFIRDRRAGPLARIRFKPLVWIAIRSRSLASLWSRSKAWKSQAVEGFS